MQYLDRYKYLINITKSNINRLNYTLFLKNKGNKLSNYLDKIKNY